MADEELYDNLARYYDKLHSDKDYGEEARKVEELIKEYKKTNGKKLLDVACGTGRHLQYLEEDFDTKGLDYAESMLDLAEGRLDKTELVQGNMINFDLEEKFDIVTCLFSSIGYAKTKQNLKRIMKNFSEHLKKGGVTIVEGFISPEDYRDESVHMDTYGDEEIKISRVSFSQRQGSLSKVKMHYLIGKGGEGVEHLEETQETGIFGTKETLEAMEKADLTAKLIKGKDSLSRRTFVGVKK